MPWRKTNSTTIPLPNSVIPWLKFPLYLIKCLARKVIHNIFSHKILCDVDQMSIFTFTIKIPDNLIFFYTKYFVKHGSNVYFHFYNQNSWYSYLSEFHDLVLTSPGSEKFLSNSMTLSWLRHTLTKKFFSWLPQALKSSFPIPCLCPDSDTP